MTTADQADRTARNTLELVQARRQLELLRAWRMGLATEIEFALTPVICDGPAVLAAIDYCLAGQPAPTSSDPREVPA